MSNILDAIVAVKWQEVSSARAKVSDAALRDLAAAQSAPRGFAAALRAKVAAGQPAPKPRPRYNEYFLLQTNARGSGGPPGPQKWESH